MCKPLKEYLGVIRDYTREIVTFGGFVIAVFIYLDFREVVKEVALSRVRGLKLPRPLFAACRVPSHSHECVD